jgi:hypothetical protein
MVISPDRDDLRSARRELTQVIEEIRGVSGFADFLSVPTFRDVTAGAGTQPVVYLTHSEAGGLALVVRNRSVQPVDLPRLTTAETRRRLDAYLAVYRAFRREARPGSPALPLWHRGLDDLCRWMWDDIVAPMLPALRGTPDVTIVACGLLGLLPLHAAWTPDQGRPTGRLYLADRFAISFAPNARTLRACRQAARELPAKRLLAVTGNDPGMPSAAAEVAAAATAFPVKTVLRGDEGTARAVKDRMTRADVVHFSCHGLADQARPMRSYLELADGRLTVADLLTTRLPMRLAVLSACETYLSGTDLPDEVVGLPSAFLQAGAAGVVASMWVMDGAVSAMVTTEFYRLWAGGTRPPAVALQGAQRWVRDTTNREKEAAWQAALLAGASWLPRDTGLYLLSTVEFAEPDTRAQAGIHDWASLAHTGV